LAQGVCVCGLRASGLARLQPGGGSRHCARRQPVPQGPACPLGRAFGPHHLGTMVFEKSLTAMVKGIRANRGKETEYIGTCIQEIQKEVVSSNFATKSMAILKLAYLSMLGYDMSWATFAVVEVMSHQRFGTKRPGYLASAISFNDSTDVGLLTINLFKKDFGSKSQYESGMAISCLSSICTPEISRDIVTDLTSLLGSSRAYLRKKVVLCLYRVFLKDPPALRTCFPKLKDRLGDEDQGVLTATVNTFLELARKNARNYLSLVPQLYHILVNTTNNWLSIKLLKVFQLLCPLELRLPAKMVEPLTNILNSTKAQSVEYEAIRCVVRTMPVGTALMALAIEKLQVFLNSSDRNLRYLALELFREVLVNPQFKDQAVVPDLHARVLESIEESDSTARKIALLLLDRIVTPASFVETVKKLMEVSKNSSGSDEFVGTILRMGARDRYALIEDFAWYLLILVEVARNLDSAHAGQVAEQMIDIAARVEQVRPYAVALALGLLSGAASGGGGGAASEVSAGAKDGGSAPEVATPVVGACAWIIGEYHEAFDSPVDATYVRAARALLAPKYIQAYEPAIQTQCIWAAAKLYFGAAKLAPSVVHDLQEMLTTHLPSFIQSTHVDVSERATLALHLANFFKVDAEKICTGSALVAEPLLPVHPDAQQGVQLPEGLSLDEAFFPPEEAPRVAFAHVRADPTDPYALAATYEDDLGFMAAKAGNKSVAAAPGVDPQSSMFYLQSRDEAAAGGTATADLKAAEGAASVASAAVPTVSPVDPLDQMRERFLANRPSVGVKYQVNRDDIQAPGAAQAAPKAAASTTPQASSGPQSLQPMPEKELTELQGRLWSMCYRDDYLNMYMCVRSKNVRKQLLRIDLRCERVTCDTADMSAPPPTVSGVALKLPTGLAAQEADHSGLVSVAAGALPERSARVKINIGLAPLVSPTRCSLRCEVRYRLGDTSGEVGGAAQLVVGQTELQIPPTAVLTPAVMNEDDVATYMARHSTELLNQQTVQALNFSTPGRTAEDLQCALPAIVGRCAGLCHFYGIQQCTQPSQQGKGQKFLLIASPPSGGEPSGLEGQEVMPEGAKIVCLCAGLPRDGQLSLRLTVKAYRKAASDDVAAQLADVFRELLEGRLRSPAAAS